MKKRILIISSVVIFSLAGFLYFVFMTGTGLEWTFNRVKGIVPDQISVKSLEGRLAGPLHIIGLRYSAPDLMVSVDEIHLDWKPLQLFSLAVYVSGADVKGIHIRTAEKEKAEEQEDAAGEFSVPVDIKAHEFMLHDIEIKTGEEKGPFVVNEVILDAELVSGSAGIEILKVKTPGFAVSTSGDIGLKDDYPLSIHSEWEIYPEGIKTIKGYGDITGSMKNLQIEQDVSSPFRAGLKASASDVLQELKWRASLSLSELTATELNKEWPVVRLISNVHAQGTLTSADIKGDFTASDRVYVGRLDGAFDAAYDNGVFIIDQLGLNLPEKNSSIKSEGRYDPSDLISPLRFTADWESLVWPLIGKEIIAASKKGDLSFSGSADDYRFGLHAFVAPAGIPESEWNVQGSGTEDEIRLEKVNGRLLDGKITGNGNVSFSPFLMWSASLHADNLDPRGISSDWKGDISLELAASGSAEENTQRARFNINGLRGQLRGYPLEGAVSAGLSGDAYELKKLDLRSGSAEVAASGSVTGRWDMKWGIDIPDLAEAYPGASGSLHSSGVIRGARQTPEIKAMLRGTENAFQEYRAGEIIADIDLDLSMKRKSAIEVQGKNIFAAGEEIERLVLIGSGEKRSHSIRLDMSTGRGDLFIKLGGSVNDDTWNGVLEQADVNSHDFGSWTLRRPSALNVSANRIMSEKLCWLYDNSSLCMEADWEKNSGINGKLDITEVPLALFDPFIPPEIQVDGAISGGADVTITTNSLLKGGLIFRMSDIPVAIDTGGEKKVRLLVTKVFFESQFNENGLSAKLDSELSDDGGINGVLELPPVVLNENLRDMKINTAELKVETANLGFIPLVFSNVRKTTGELEIGVSISGTVGSPLLQTGIISLEKGSADIPELGLRLKEIEADAGIDDTGSVTVSVSSGSGEGVINIKGNAQIKTKNEISADIRINGENFEAIRTPEIQVLVSPALNINMDGRRVGIKGEVAVPEATIEPRTLSSAVQPSEDVVITGKKKSEKEEEWKVYSDVRLTLGEKIHFDGFGLTCNLTGGITVVEAPGRTATGTGELRVTDGRYKAYGQDLEIEKGRLLFTGGPVDNPGLDIKAARYVDEVTAGIIVSGTLQSPLIELYSTPVMDDTEILSYIILGRPLNQASSSESGLLVKAAASTGLKGGNFIARKLGTHFGIEEIEIQSGDSYEEAALYIGKYISPKLYLGYSIGLFEPVNTVIARYRISRRWLLQGESGTGSGGDIIFEMER